MESQIHANRQKKTFIVISALVFDITFSPYCSLEVRAVEVIFLGL